MKKGLRATLSKEIARRHWIAQLRQVREVITKVVRKKQFLLLQIRCLSYLVDLPPRHHRRQNLGLLMCYRWLLRVLLLIIPPLTHHYQPRGADMSYRLIARGLQHMKCSVSVLSHYMYLIP